MMKRNGFVAAIMVIFLVSAGLAFAQNSGSGSNREMSVEESYLQESIEMMIIREASRTDSMEQKLVALEYIGDAINRGNRGEEVRQNLEYLAFEGVVNKARENGRLVGDYPLVRTKAATYLGELGTPEAKTTLLKIVNSERQSMVTTEAIKSLAKIAANDNGETVRYIVAAFDHFDITNPDNLVALSTVDAFQKIAEKNGGIKDPDAARVLIRISGGPYIRSVQDKAKYVLSEMRQYNASQR
jgi:hypothetical protein